MTKEQLKEIVDTARELGLPQVEIDGVKYTIGPVPTVKPQIDPNAPELKAEDLVKPLSVLDEMDGDEILYWATPHYDELMAKKEAMKQAKKEQE